MTLLVCSTPAAPFSGEREAAICEFEAWQFEEFVAEMRKLDKVKRLLAGAQQIRRKYGASPWPER